MLGSFWDYNRHAGFGMIFNGPGERRISMKGKKWGKGISLGVFRCIRWLVKLFYPKIRLEGTENLPDGPCVVAGNHAQMNGPIACELYLPGDRAIWCAGEMMKLRDVPAYAYADFWSGKPKGVRWFYKGLSYVIAPLAVCVFNNAHTIAVYRDARGAGTFRNTVRRLEEGAKVVIFPEGKEKRNRIVNQFQDKFVDVARLYHKRTGKALPFVPVYVAPRLKTIYFGKPVRYRPEEPAGLERQRVAEALMRAVTELAEELPVHTVVPYDNIPSKRYPASKPQEAE